MSKNFHYGQNDRVTYRTFTGDLREVKVTQRVYNIKNGRDGFDGVVMSGPEKGSTVWGYDDQIEEVFITPLLVF